jgi:methylamine utilization protein MauE
MFLVYVDLVTAKHANRAAGSRNTTPARAYCRVSIIAYCQDTLDCLDTLLDDDGRTSVSYDPQTVPLGVQGVANVASVVLAVVLSSTMLYAAASKLATPWNLKKTLDALGLSSLAWPLAAALITVEAATGMGTAVGAVTPVVAVAAIGLLVLFAAAGIWARLGRISASCSCFGVGQSKLGLRTAGRALLLALGYAAYLVIPAPPPLQSWAPPLVVLVTLSLGVFAWLRTVSNPARIGV